MRICKKLIAIVVAAVQFTNCSGFAAPQTSIPLPENDPVSISGPDANGLVTLTSGANSNLANAKLIVSVNSPTATSQKIETLLSLNVFDVLISTASAQSECSTGLTTTCPTLDNNQQCEATANADGSFSIEVPATASDSISASYLDPSTCEEILLIDNESIPTDVVTLSFEAKMIEWENSLDSLFIYGEDNGVPVLHELNDADFSIKNSADLTDLISPSNEDRSFFDFIEFADGNSYISLINDIQPLFLPYSDNMSLDQAVSVQTPDLIDAENYFYLTSHTVDIDATNYSNFACSNYSYPSTATRLFFSEGDTGNIYIVDDTGSFPPTHLQTRELVFDPSLEPDFNGYTLDTILRLEVSASDPSLGLMVFSAISSSNTLVYWAATVSLLSGLCDNNLNIVDLLQLSNFPETSPDNLGVVKEMTASIDGQSQKWFAVFADNSYLVLFNDDLSLQSNSIDTSTLFSSAPTESPEGIALVQDPDGGAFLHLLFVWNGSEPILAATYSIDSNTAIENSDFASDYFTILNVIDAALPDELDLYMQNPNTYILDSGLDDDNKSFLIHKNLDEAL